MAEIAMEEFLLMHPELRNQYTLLSLIATESPRGMVLIAAAELDRLLQELLSNYLRPGYGLKALLGESDGPLSTFSSKISLAHAIGLITDLEFRKLNLIRRIRNEFAHQTDASFDKSPIKDRVRELANNDKGSGPEAFEFVSTQLAFELEAALRVAKEHSIGDRLSNRLYSP
ncbi:hypothetical protein U8P76_01730 [Rhizobium johnstonii]|uniref:hypothetical protein n=1 Tax=Rhizobium leguminosarum TaxID=384 RepID=UPI0013BF0368|nr:hypothetical protein [Rhizobium leguminosarum]WSG95787.1 hypothetical protein U8P76_01730 [Rhizobium johnstonii]NEH99226.1 hypothetical protein [Rhizobium leguminosarum]NEJ42310.1 hypothetical protein [Rhizobium leguminosarum]NEJ48881.1 hypothetical protein [Rhizobium leguminosarum]NEJ82546.1 hypothetical protein [Rhizobium leguminosarum]